jgi:hypothetical protein
MVETVFLLGCPGSGKSTSVHCIEMIGRDGKLSVNRFTDYQILDNWFHADKECLQFRPSKYGGFDILDDNIYDEALAVMRGKILEYKSLEAPDLIVVDFARADYRSAFELLGKHLIQNSHFLLFKVEIATCIQRIRERVRTATSFDDHFTSEFVLETYDQPNYIGSIVTILEEDFQINEQRIRIIDNSSRFNKHDLYAQMLHFVRGLKQKQDVLPV